jgi:uncharacterized membrane protein
MIHIVASLTDNSRGISYNCSAFIVQATEVFVPAKFFNDDLLLARKGGAHSVAVLASTRPTRKKLYYKHSSLFIPPSDTIKNDL